MYVSHQNFSIWETFAVKWVFLNGRYRDFGLNLIDWFISCLGWVAVFVVQRILINFNVEAKFVLGVSLHIKIIKKLTRLLLNFESTQLS